MATVALSGIITPTNVVTATSTTTLTNKTLTAPTIASANLTTALTLAGAAGSSGQVMTSAGSGLPSWTTLSSGLVAATQAEMETATSNTVATTPLSTNWHPGVAKTWGVFSVNGIIRTSLNVASITDGGLGIVELTYTTNFSSAYYSPNVTSDDISVRVSFANIATTGLGLRGRDVTNTSWADPGAWYFSCFGDQ